MFTKPVFLISGFLDSGKTSFIEFTIQQPYFRQKGKTLIICQEQGVVEYNEKTLRQCNTVIEYIDSMEGFTKGSLLRLDNRHKPHRVVIELNGMWNMPRLDLPPLWSIEQKVCLADTQTFTMYYNNMRSIFTQMIQNADLVILNRAKCENADDRKLLINYKRNILAMNQKTQIAFEGENEEIYVTADEELPYDVSKPHIDLTDNTYAVWYFDMIDDLSRYIGKTVSFLGVAQLPENCPESFAYCGRPAMTCCADDIAFLAFACKCEKAGIIKEGDWIRLTAEIGMEFFAGYNGEGPVLTVLEIERTGAPKEVLVAL